MNRHISRRKSLALLAFLATTGKIHSRDELAALCYPDYDQTSARNNLRHDLFELKTSLGGGCLVSDHEQVSLKIETDLWVDVNEFRRLVEKASQHHPNLSGSSRETLCDDCRVRLADAAELYSADFLAGFTLPGSREFEEWQFFQAESLRQSLAEALQLLIQWHINRRESEPGILYSRGWLALDPLHEPAQRQLIRLYAWSDQQSAALRQYQECVRLLHDELGVEPEEETIALDDAIRSRKFAGPVQNASPGAESVPKTGLPGLVYHNLPMQDAPLTGREGELGRIISCLGDDADCRLLTLTGPGGIGKTRLAVEAATRLAEEPNCPFYDGIYFVSLSGISQADSIIPTIADPLQLPLLVDPDQRTRQLLDFLQPKRLLLLLDNFEHLVTPQSIQLLVDLLAHAPQVKLLVTSRTRLKAHSEHILQLSGLDVPPSNPALHDQPVERTSAGYSAVDFFVQSARRSQPDFLITADNLLEIVRICRLVEGMPLGIELATAWLDVLAPAEIAAEVEQSLDFLAASWPDRPERHHSLRAVFDSSWRLLADVERSALMGMTLFQGHFSRQAAQAVSGASIHTLLALQNKSWLKYHEDGRFQIHELLNQYANERLQSDPAAWQLTRERFCNYYAEYLADLAEKTKGPRQKETFNAIGSEFENIRLAWQWLVESDRIEFAVEHMLFSLYRYAGARWKFFDLKRLLEPTTQAILKGKHIELSPHILSILLIAGAAFDQYGRSVWFATLGVILPLIQAEDVRQAWALTGGKVETLQAMGFWGALLCYLIAQVVDKRQMIALLHQLGSNFREQNRRWELANTFIFMVAILIGTNQIEPDSIQDEVQPHALDALAIFQEMGDDWLIGSTQRYWGWLLYLQEKYPEALEQLEAAQANLEKAGDNSSAAYVIYYMVRIYEYLGDFDSMFQYQHIFHQRMEEIGDKAGAAAALSDESIVALRFSNLEHACQTRLESLSLYLDVGHAHGAAWATWEMGEIKRVAGDLARAQEWFEKARLMFEDIEDRTSPVFYQRGLGDIAQMTGDYCAAEKHFQESARQAQVVEHSWGQAYALCGLGRAEIALNKTEEAREHYSQALLLARRFYYPEMALVSMAGFVSLFASRGDAEQAVELGTLVLNQKLSWNETRSQMAALLDSLTTLSPEVFVAAQERGRNSGIKEAIRHLLS